MQGSYEQHLQVCADVGTVQSVVAVIRKPWAGPRTSSSSSSSSGGGEDDGGSSDVDVQDAALDLCVVLGSSAPGRRVGGRRREGHALWG
jgi:hypothetical protein